MERELLRHEIAIIWEENPNNFDYVREYLTTHPCRRRIKKWPLEGRRVGYSVLAPNAPSEGGRKRSFVRREFFVKEYDRDSEPNGIYSVGCPIEGVDPRTVRPRVPGKQTERSWGAPLSLQG